MARINRNRKVYGRAKRLEMARSVLPSTWRRQAAREAARIHRRSRHAVAGDLRRYTGDAVGAIARYDEDGFDVIRSPKREIGELVCDRRGADKLGSFRRWATVKSRH